MALPDWRVIDKDILSRLGGGSTAVVMIGVALNHWGALDLTKLPIPHFLDALYFWLILNAGGAWALARRRGRVAVGKHCPQCEAPLTVKENYTCAQCGDISFIRPN